MAFGIKAIQTRYALLLAALALAAPRLAFCQPLKVASYNVWGLPSPLLRHSERFKEIPAAVNALDADVVLIQEAFNSDSKALTHLARFPYYAWGPPARFAHFSSGLLVLSRYPIVESATASYSQCGGFDCFASKGAVYVKVLVPGMGAVSVFDTHLNANGHPAVRLSQAAELLKFVHGHSGGRPTIVGGDFNGDGMGLLRGITQGLVTPRFPKIHDAHGEYVNQNPELSAKNRDGFTADPERNPFLSRSESQRRLDHIFLMDGLEDGNRFEQWQVLSDGLVLDGTAGKVLSDHFGVRISAELQSKSRL